MGGRQRAVGDSVKCAVLRRSGLAGPPPRPEDRFGYTASMEVVLQLPDEIARRFAGGGDVSRRAIESIAIEGYRSRSLTLLEVSELLGLDRIEAEDFLARNQVTLESYDDAGLDREAAVLLNAGY